ncbi:MAG: lipocalin family protein [Bacteroidales bacterium]|nr:lipocalin family protein [Bacteroidales bacterium]MDD3430936.1 lipocalin family protein [Bacteroidales bacterium]MDD4361846.1 lipocalin family protein [Bacteroidales bacterium]MDD4429922.1 lipocalin family protein [Bacteroidales bacterium]
MKTKTKNPIQLLLMFLMAGLYACSSTPDSIVAIENFDKAKYLGKWYEIARIDFKFEKDLNNTTAEYSLNDNGTIKVDNRGYNTVKEEWEQAIGKAKFVGDETVARLKVSFFGPFYSGYNVIALDDDYRYALVAGENFDYLWILSRENTIPGYIEENYLQIAEDAGFDTSRLLWVEHNEPE